MSEITPENVVLIVLAVMPGLVSAQFYRLLMPSRPIEWKESLSQGLFYSVANFALLSPLVWFVLNGTNRTSHAFWYWLAIVGLFIGGPVLWPFLLRAAFRWSPLRAKIQVPYPTAWDFFFDSRQPAFLLIRMNDGSLLGGYWGPSSYAGSFPNDGDIYLEATYHLKPDGKFASKVDGTRGALVRKDQYTLIELYSAPTLEGATDDGQGQ